MSMASEQHHGFYGCHIERCSDGAEARVCMSGAVPLGFMDGQKDGERDASFGCAGAIFDSSDVAI